MTTIATVDVGGTGLSSLTSGYIPYGNGTGALGSSSNLTYNGTGLFISGSSDPTLNLNSIASGSWKSEIVFENSGSAKWATGVDIAGTGNNNFYWYDSVNGVERMRLSPAGYLGIGTNNPTYKLTVSDAQSGGGYFLSSNTGGYSFIQLENTGGGRAWQLATGGSASGYAGSLGFYDSTSGIERMRIATTGYVGIGTTTPTLAQFSAVSSTAGLPAIQATALSGTTQQAIQTWTNSTNAGYVSLAGVGTTSAVSSWSNGSMVLEAVPYSSGNFILSAYSGAMTFQTNGRTEAMRIDVNGNLGVGLTNPSSYYVNGTIAKVAVNGNIYANVLQSQITQQGFPIPEVGGSSAWVLLGTYNAGQGGYVLHLRIYAHAGYNSNNGQNGIADVYFKTANGSSSQSGSTGAFYGDGQVFHLGPTQSPSIVQAVQVSTSQYQLFAYMGQYSNGSYYTIDSFPGTGWTHSGAITSPSGNYITLTSSTITYTTP